MNLQVLEFGCKSVLAKYIRYTLFFITYYHCLGICKYWNMKVKYNFERSVEMKVMEFGSNSDSGGNASNGI